MNRIVNLKLLSIFLGLLPTILFSSCFLVCNTAGVTVPQEEIMCSNNIGKELICQIGIKGNHYPRDNAQYTLWQYMRGDSTMSIKKKNVAVRYKGIESPIQTLRVQDTSKWRKWWKKYWMMENVDWRKVRHYGFPEYAYMKIDFESNIALGDSLEIIERDFPKKGDSVIITAKLPLSSSKLELRRSWKSYINKIDADSLFIKMKNQMGKFGDSNFAL
jgi:hypothetical protein